MKGMYVKKIFTKEKGREGKERKGKGREWHRITMSGPN